MSKTIADKYKETNGQFIILISGLSASGKTELGENISRDFHFKKLDTNKFYKKDFDEKIKLPNGITIVNYDTDDAFDWDEMNKAVNELKQNGVVVMGNVFPTDKLEFKTDFHIHLKISKQELKQRRTEYIEKHPEKNLDNETEMLRINICTYPYYLEALKRMKISKFMDVSEMKSDAIYDQVFDEMIKFINSNVYEIRKVSRTKSPDTLSERSETFLDDEDYYVVYREND